MDRRADHVFFVPEACDDEAALRLQFQRTGRVRIPNAMATGAAASLREHLLVRDDWRQVFNMQDRLYELDRAAWEALPLARRDELQRVIMANATAGFQFRYETLRISDTVAARRTDPTLLARFVEWFSGGWMQARIARITGIDDVRFADAQATRYSPGDLLTGHDDDIRGKGRRAAYVVGLTPQWRVEWGGALLFHLPDGRIEGVAPGYNCVDIFSVPQMHSVSQVTHSACFPRLSVTGWLRNQAQPA